MKRTLGAIAALALLAGCGEAAPADSGAGGSPLIASWNKAADHHANQLDAATGGHAGDVPDVCLDLSEAKPRAQVLRNAEARFDVGRPAATRIVRLARKYVCPGF